MRLLVLTPRTPYPPVGGDRLRLYHMVRHLAGRHEVTLYSLAGSRVEAALCRELSGTVARLRTFVVPRPLSLVRSAVGLLSPGQPMQTAFFHSTTLAAAVHRALRRDRFDAVLGSLIRTAPYLLGAPVPVVIDVQDSISLHYRRALPHLVGRQRLLYRIEMPRVERQEREVLRRATAVTAISPVDRDDLLRREPGARIAVAGNGVDLQRFRPLDGVVPRPDRLLFLANLRTLSNRDMAQRCAHEVLPRVRARRPAAHLHVVGTEPAPEVRALHDGHAVHVIGPVAHPADHLREAMVTLCPMRWGAGLQNKILESLAVGVPAVVSPMAAAPLGLRDGEGILIADGAADQARACLQVLEDPGLRARLGRAGRAVAERRFHWTTNLEPLDELLREVVAGG